MQENELIQIENELNEIVLGQKSFIKTLLRYFNNKIESNEKGIIFLLGDKDTGKNTCVKHIFKSFKKDGKIENDRLTTINISSYDFNLGFNAFISDLYEGLNDDSVGIIFKNFDKGNKEILNILSNIMPNSCLMLKESYIMKNKILIKSSEENDDSINKFICHNKFFIFTSNDEEVEIDKLFNNGAVVQNKVVLKTKALSKNQIKVIVKKILTEEIKKLNGKYNTEMLLGYDKTGKEKGTSVIDFLGDTFKKDNILGIQEYITYKFYKPLDNILGSHYTEKKSSLVLYIKENEIWCDVSGEEFMLSDYSVASIDEVKYKIQSMIGMKELKDYIDSVENHFKVQKIRERLGLKTANISMNMIFTGNAGTGKTNAARLTFEFFNALGILNKGIFKEVSKSDFVSDNIEEISKITNDIINSALGGVLFVDEAYALCKDENDKAGLEIVDALLKGIEDNRDNIIVILAGYKGDMERFLSFNQGLKSRFSNTINFRDYTPNEMYEIAINIAKSKGYSIDENIKDDLIELFTRNQLIGKNDLGNARFVRNIIDNAIIDASKNYLSGEENQLYTLKWDNFNFKVKAKFNLEKKLGDIIGLDEVKELLRNQYKLIAAQEKRRAAGIDTKIEQNLNMVFAGNPGTGKTSIARLVAEMLNRMGLLKIGQLIETDRGDFVSETKAETTKKTEAKFKEAIGGVLFIDEAYTLAADEIGRSSIETLLKLIEDNMGEIVVILAGYEKEMEDFFDVNIGLRSRFPVWTHFNDYNPEELFKMAVRIIEGKGFKISKNGLVELRKSLEDVYENSDAQSGNGRMVRNYVENLIRNQSIRVAENEISVYELNLINTTDIEKINMSDYGKEYNVEDGLKVLIGREKEKEFIRNQYKLIKLVEKREKLSIKANMKKNFNMIFAGNEGVGKRTVSKILAEMFYATGITKSKSLVEVNIRELEPILIEGKNIDEVLRKALGKLVIIGGIEYLLKSKYLNEFAYQINNYIKINQRATIILSGTEEVIKAMFNENRELGLNFSEYLKFEDYSNIEISNVAFRKIINRGYLISEEDAIILRDVVIELSENEDIKIPNGELVDSYINILLKEQGIRVYSSGIKRGDKPTIKSEDILNAKEKFKEKFIIINFENLNNKDLIKEMLELKELYKLNLITEDEFRKLKLFLIK